MITRFLDRSRAWPAALLLAAVSTAPAARRADTAALDQRAAVTRHLDMTYTMPEYRTREAWLERRRALRQQILSAAGLQPMPEKTPLAANVFGRIERPGYTIEKVYFESYPGFYVTGNLYRPSGRSGPFPAVVSPHGHWVYGRLQNSEACSVPARAANLARQGYIVFTYDMVGYNDSRQVNHRFRGEREELWGFGSLGLHLWNSIRAVDFLEGMPDVDRARIGATGASGGGTQTFLLTAVDDRIAVSAPVNMVSAHMQGGDVCENAPNLRIDTNNMEIAAMMAPRPMIMVSATGDWTKNTLQVEYPAVQRIYRLFDALDSLTAVQVRAEHNYNKESREHVYRWFGRSLLGVTDAPRLAEKNESLPFPPELLVFYGRALPEGARTERQVADAFIESARAAIERLKPAGADGLRAYRDAFEPALRSTLMAEPPPPASVEANEISSAGETAYRVSRLELRRSGKGDRVPATIWTPPRETPRRAVLLLHPRGAAAFEDGAAPGATVRTLVRERTVVLAPDLFNTGRAAFKRAEVKNFFTCYNRTDDANRVQDILTAAAYLRSRAAGLPLKVAGAERAGLWSILARAFDGGEASWAVDLAGFDAASDESFLRLLNIPGIRRAGDFKSAALLNQRGRLWIHGAGPGFPADWIQSVYTATGAGARLRISSASATEAEILAWLREE
jgi:dienelactone hydrolase